MRRGYRLSWIVNSQPAQLQQKYKLSRVGYRLFQADLAERRNHVRHSRFSHTTRMGEALKMEEYVPLNTPTSRVTTKWRMVIPPKSARVSNVSMTVNCVLIERT